MAALLEDLLDFLEAQGLVGDAAGFARAAGYLPPSPDKVIAVYSTGGLAPEIIVPDITDEVAYDDVTFQVRGRGDAFGYAELEERMRAVYLALHGTSLGDVTNYILVQAVQAGPLPLGLDDNNRPGLTWNFVAMRNRDADDT